MKKIVFISTILIFVLMTGCTKFPDIGAGYKLVYNSRGDLGIVNSANSYLVYGHILEYAFDSRFIIVAERPRESVPECLYLKGEKFKDCEKAFKRSSFRQYWIIDKEKESIFDEKTKIYSNVYGPYKKDTYLVKKKELGVPDSLKLKTE